MDLATVRPTGPDPVWGAVATGMYPAKNGVRSPSVYYVRGDTRPLALLPDHCFSHVLVHLGFLRREPNTSRTLRARPLWSILADAGITAGVVRWPLTFPAQQVHGFVVSDRFHQLLGSFQEFDESAAYPSDVLPVARGAFADPGQTLDWLPSPVSDSVALSPEASAGLRDQFYSRAIHDLRAQWPVQLSAVRYQGLDTVGHYNLRYTEPRDVAGAREDERRRRLQVIDRYYGYIDSEIGAAISELMPGDLLLVVSGFGMEPPNAVKRLLGRVIGDPMSGTHERAPDGFLLAYGTTVEPGRHQRGSIVDVAPTVLYFLGLPVGRDMDGYARADLFRSTFTAERPIAFVPTHNR
jgi:predicted AlkP superfamily phosphohydrolase/phosphomutase